MNKKLLLTFMLSLFLLSFASAAKIDYSPNDKGVKDMKVDISDDTFFGLIKTKKMGTMELKSHKSPTDIKTVGTGWQVTMIYETNFGQAHKGALGDISFIDLDTGKEVDKKYKIVYLDGQLKEREVCVKYENPNLEESRNTKMTEEEIEEYILNYQGDCLEYGKETYGDGEWKEYNSKDIPKGKIILGLMVNNKIGEKIDGIWEVENKKIEKHAAWDVIETLTDATGIIRSVNFNHDGSLLATGSHDDKVRIYDTSTWTRQEILTDATSSILSVNFNHDGSLLATGSNDDNVRIYDTSTWTRQEILTDATSAIYSVNFNHDGSLLATGSSNKKVYIYDASYIPKGVTLLSPHDAFMSGTEPVDFSANVTGFDGTVENVSLVINDTIEQTNTSGADGVYNFTETLSDGFHEWRVIAYNNDNEIFYSDTNRTLTVDSTLPILDAFLNTSTIYNYGDITGLNYTITDDNLDTCWYEYNSTNITFSCTSEVNGLEGITTVEGETNITVYANDTAGNENYEHLSFVYESIPPIISISSPISSYDYLAVGQEIDLRFTANDTNLDSCWYNYNGTNQAVSCSNGALAETNFTLEEGNNNITVYSNDTVGNENSETTSWNYKIFENSRTHNLTSYETASERFNINVAANDSLTDVNLVYNGTEYETTKSGNIYTKILDIPVSQIGNNSVKWKFTYAGEDITSRTTYQTIEETIFTECNGTYDNNYLTLKFKDEAALSFINASIPFSSFKYYLGSGSQYKTYTYTDTSLNPEYNFCAYPNRTLNVNPYVQYKQGTESPQRIWDADVSEYNSTVTEKILYLLNSLDGIYVTFQVINSIEQGVDGVSVIGTRTIEGETVIVADGETGAGGGITFWLNTDFIHNFKFTKEGYEDYIIDITPTQATYTVTLGGEQEEKEDYLTGISINVNPTGEFLKKNEVYNFLYNIEAQNSNLESYGFTLKADSSEIETQSGTNPSGEELNYVYNVSSANRITMEYYYVINGTTRSYTYSWNTYQPNDFSIKHFLDNLVSKIDNNLFGISGDDNGVFAKSLLSLLILIVGAGLISSRYGLASEQAVSGILFGMILFLNTINFFPTLPESFPIQVDLGTTIIFISATWLVISIFKEESR
ncbi:MAG: hypothetical protein R6U59_08165 [Eubacteriales bacterium]